MATNKGLTKKPQMEFKRELAIEKRRELDVKDKQLAQQKRELEDKLVHLKNRRKELMTRDVSLKEKMLKYDKSIQDVNHRRERALTISVEEELQLKIKNDQIIKLKSEVKMLQVQKEEMQRRHKQSPIHQFFEKVIEASNGELRQTKDVVLKYESLKNVERELWTRQRATQTFITEEKHNIYKSMQERRKEILQRKLQLSKLKDCVAMSLKQSNATHRELMNLSDRLTENTILEERLKMAIWNMANKLSKHTRQTTKSDDPIQQLNSVQQYIEDLVFIITEIGKSEKADSDLAQATSSTGKPVAADRTVQKRF